MNYLPIKSVAISFSGATYFRAVAGCNITC